MRLLVVFLSVLLSGCIIYRDRRPPSPQAPYTNSYQPSEGQVHRAAPVATPYAAPSYPAPSYPAPSYPAPSRIREWRFLGSRTVGFGRDRDTIHVGSYDGTFEALEIRVERSGIVLYDMAVDFAGGTRWHPPHALVFGANSWSHVIDLPGDRRVIRDVHFLYRDLPGGGLAKVELWGR